MNPGTLLIRADASPAIGTGHVMRCLSLAQAWREIGGEVVFAMAETTGAISHRLGEERCRLLHIDAVPGSESDSARTRDLIMARSPAWVVLDGYVFGSEYRSVLRESGRPCLVVDDNGGTSDLNCDLVLNQNVHATKEMYPNLRPGTRLLLGPRFACLRNEFVAYREYSRAVPERASRILVTMGGSDPSNFTPRVLDAMACVPEDVEVRVILGGSAENKLAEHPAVTALSKRVTYIRDVRNMAELMAWADLAIAAAGTTTWEICLLGLPAILVAAAENQRPIAQGVATAGAAIDLGPVENVHRDVLLAAIEDLRTDWADRLEISRAARSLVDGFGRDRVLEAMRVGDRVCA